jgi:HPt (histidine-containing phosphotransfer) domain-containing protein
MVVDGVMVPIVAVVCVAVTTIGFPLARAYARRLEHAPREPSVPAELQSRLERMEQALDSIAIEVERISEGQRFTTKLLSERSKAEANLPERAP